MTCAPPHPHARLALCVLAAALLHGALLLGLDSPLPNAATPALTVPITLTRPPSAPAVAAATERSALAEPHPQVAASLAKPAPAAAVAPQASPKPKATPPTATPPPAPALVSLAGGSPLALARAVAQSAAPSSVGVGEPRLAPGRASPQGKDFDYYLDAWRRQVERVGQLNYPGEARARKLAGTLRLRVIIAADGTLEDVRITQSSGHAVLDDAALRIVRLAAPYAPFSPTMRAVAEVLEIERSWQFRNSRLST